MKRLKVVVLIIAAVLLLAVWQGVGASLSLGKFRAGWYGGFSGSTYMDVWTPWGGCFVTNGMSAVYYDEHERDFYCWRIPRAKGG